MLTLQKFDLLLRYLNRRSGFGVGGLTWIPDLPAEGGKVCENLPWGPRVKTVKVWSVRGRPPREEDRQFCSNFGAAEFWCIL